MPRGAGVRIWSLLSTAPRGQGVVRQIDIMESKMRLAYADPPYIGQARYYPEQTEVDHLELLRRLCCEYDGWALSCSSPSLKRILELEACPTNVRVGVWVKPFCSFKPGVNPAYAWEPVIFVPARARGREKPTVRDWVAVSIAKQRGLIGAKPARFCFWLFDILGAEPGDDFEDLYPGTGIVGRAWKAWCEQHSVKQLELT